jgi:hypothetical protein
MDEHLFFAPTVTSLCSLSAPSHAWERYPRYSPSIARPVIMQKRKCQPSFLHPINHNRSLDFKMTLAPWRISRCSVG